MHIRLVCNGLNFSLLLARISEALNFKQELEGGDRDLLCLG
jgi:hypothetical protein